jgi:hypothetical protein
MRENMIFGLLSLANLTQDDILFHLLVNDQISLFFMAEQNFIVYKYHILKIHLSVVEHLGCF